MGVVSLPVVGGNASLEDALDVMRKSRRCGIVAHAGNEFRLFRAIDLSNALRETSVRHLADLTGTTIHVGNVTEIANATAEPYLSSDLLFQSLQESGLKFGLLSAPTHGSKKAIIYSLDDISMDFVEGAPDDKKKPKGG
jgi:hypothetical protein